MNRFRSITLFAVAMLDFVLVGGQPAAAAPYDRPIGNPRQSRSVVVAEHGIVAASVPLAAQVGLDVLKAGGTVVNYSPLDAAKVPNEIEVYDQGQHGWCVPDMPNQIYNKAEAERAWGKLLALYKAALV